LINFEDLQKNINKLHIEQIEELNEEVNHFKITIF
jgi:hypothetical protein